MTKEMSKIIGYSFIGLFIVISIYLIAFMYFTGYFNNILTGKVIDDNLEYNELYTEDVIEEDNPIIEVFIEYWWIFLITFIAIIIIIILLIILRKIKSQVPFYNMQTQKKYTGDPIIDKSLDLIKRSIDAGLSDKEISKIFQDAGWKNREIKDLLKQYRKEVELKKT